MPADRREMEDTGVRQLLVRLVTTAAALTGFAIAVLAIVPRGVVGDGGLSGVDAHAYWSAGRAVLEGGNLYPHPPGDMDAYLYPPPFAQLLAPIAGLLPAGAFIWLWRAFSVACLVVATGGWRAAGIVLLVFPPAIIELDAANVHFPLAAICALAMRGRTGTLPFAFLLKLSGLATLPYGIWRNWRSYALGALVVAIVVAASYLSEPRSWSDYAAFLASPEPTNYYWTNLGSQVPRIARLAFAGVIGLLAIRWVALLPFAFLLSMPTLWLNSLAVLVCLANPVRDWLAQRPSGWPELRWRQAASSAGHS